MFSWPIIIDYSSKIIQKIIHPSSIEKPVMPKYKFTLNQQAIVTPDVAKDTPLLWVLRDALNLQGTKYGCGKGLCGACTVHFNGSPTRACQLPVEAASEQKITTIEGLATADKLHPVQQAWLDLDVPQCGYCQAGQIMSAVSLLENIPQPTDEQIEQMMSGNICRCGTYNRIKDAIKVAAGLKDDSIYRIDIK